jgi:serine/threonine-protein kinase
MICVLADARATRDDPEAGPTQPVDERRVQRNLEVFHGIRYRTGQIIGRGGMGEVRLCGDTLLQRSVARKVIHRDRDPSAFLEEARIQARLEHPAIPPVYDFGLEDGQPYLTMRQISGTTLEQILANARSDPQATPSARARRLAIFVQTCGAVAYAHSRGVVHRDLKPSNVMIGEFGEVYVLDWGIAGTESDGQPRGGGTGGYLAPERILDPTSADHRVDIYALGAVLFELLTGERLFEGGHLTAVDASFDGNHDVASRLDELAVDLPPELIAVCQRATQANPAHRYPSVAAMVADIERFLDGDRDLRRRADEADRLIDQAERVGAKEDELTRRASLLRAAGRALALVPNHPRALALLRDLLASPPETSPPAVLERLAAADIEETRQQAAAALTAIVGWAVLLGAIVAMGLRWTPAFIALVILVVALLGLGIQRSVQGGPSKRPALVGAAVASAALTITSLLFGPFVLVPVICTASITVFTIDSRGGRALLLGLFVAPIALPWLAELMGWIPPSMAIDGTLVLAPRLADYSPTPTLWVLALGSVAGVVLAHRTVGRGRRLLLDARRQVAVQAWQLEQVVPGAASPVTTSNAGE